MRNRDADHAERLVSVGVNSPRNIGPFNAETNYGWIDITQSVCVTRLNFWEDEACQFGGIKTELRLWSGTSFPLRYRHELLICFNWVAQPQNMNFVID